MKHKGDSVFNLIFLILSIVTTFAQSPQLGTSGFYIHNDDLGLSANAGSPSVQLAANGFYMAFDFPISPLPQGCSEASEIRVASSPTELGPWAMLNQPRLGVDVTRPCGAMDPALVIGDTPGELAMVYNILDGSGQYRTGIWFKGTGLQPITQPVPTLDGLSDLSVVKYDGAWWLFGIDRDPLSPNHDNLVTATSVDMVNWTNPTFSLDPAYSMPDAADGLASPSVSCVDGLENLSWNMWTLQLSAGDTAFTKLSGVPNGNWYVSGRRYHTWSGAEAWNSIEHITDASARTFLYHGYTDSTGVHKIGVASNSPDPAVTLDRTTSYDRDCLP